jgi:DNA polymerase I-like protein with 3'-5' exonuclease and polymerase domains
MRFITNNQSLSREQIDEVLLSPKQLIAVDIEYVSLENPLPLGIGIATDADTGFYFFNPKDELVKGAIESSEVVLMHNVTSDVPLLDKLGIKLQHFEDTMLLAFSCGIMEKSLATLAESVLHRPNPSVTSQWRKPNQGNIGIDHVKMGGMCITHACNTYAVWETLPKPDLYWDIDRPFVDLILEMEYWGVLIDQYALTRVEQQTMSRVLPMEADLKAELEVENLGSNPQVAAALRAKGIIGTRKTKSDKDSVSDESLSPLDLPLTNKLLKWRSEMKTITTYVPAFRGNTNDKGVRQGLLDEHGRLHSQFGYARTGRLTSKKPNQQNITRDDKFDYEEEE